MTPGTRRPGPLIAAALALAAAPALAVPNARQEPVAPVREATVSVPRGKRERLRLDREVLRASLAAMESSDVSAQLLQATRRLLKSPATKGGYPFEDWTLREKDLRFYSDWTVPGSRDAAHLSGSDGAREQAAVEAIAGYARELEAHGVDLFVVLLPLRIQVYPEWVPGVRVHGDFEGAGPDYTHLLLELSEAGVEVIDLLPAFARARDEPAPDSDRYVFLRHNHHWTPRGMELCADRVSSRALRLPGLERGPARAGVDFSIRRRLEEVTNVRIKRPEPAWLSSVVGPDGTGKADALDRDSPILLMGDSFVMYYEGEHSDLASHLYARTGHRIDRIYNPGSGFGAWKSLARRKEGVDGKRLVVWVCSSRSLLEPPMSPESLFEE